MSAGEFLNATLEDSGGCWDFVKIRTIAGRSVPDLVAGLNRDLLRSDVHYQWARWFVESLLDPWSLKAQDVDYCRIFGSVWVSVNARYVDLPHAEKKELAGIAAKKIYEIAKGKISAAPRRTISSHEKRLLLELAGRPPRCYYCGAVFAEEAIANYLGHEKADLTQPLLFDILRPRGLLNRDLQIEIDHMVPFSHGGGDADNLKLACGWCNRHKSSYVSMFDLPGIPIRCGPNVLGLTTLPHPFWTLRLLSVRKHCEYNGGCDKSSKSDQLMIAPVCENGALNPSNLRVTCIKHDPLHDRRFQPLSIVRSMWRTQAEDSL